VRTTSVPFYVIKTFVPGCSHFTWAPLRKGTCWLRSGHVNVDKAFYRKAPGLLIIQLLSAYSQNFVEI
jgi:hypothetical protein